MSAPIVERLLLCAEIGDMGRKPDPTDVHRVAADTITDLLAALSAAKGYMLNARFDLETGTKAAGIVTIEGGIKRIEAAIAKAKAVQP